jgi:hypothetical protein
MPHDADTRRQEKLPSQWLRRIGVAHISTLFTKPHPNVQAAHDNQLTINYNDWLQLREKVASLRGPAPYLASVGWTCIGVILGAIFVLPVWLPVDSDLPAKDHLSYAFITPLLIMIIIAGAVIAAYTFAVRHQANQVHAAAVDNVLADMDTLYKLSVHAGASQNG